MKRNTVEFQIEGKTRGVRTGTMAIAIAVKECGAASTQEFYGRLASQDLLAVQALFYGSAYQYAQWKGQSIDFNITQVSEWIEDIGDAKASELTDKLLESYVPKNSNPPETPGVTQPSTTGSTSASPVAESPPINSGV